MLSAINLQFSGCQLLRNSVLLISMLMLSTTAMADRPEWAGGGDGDGENAHKHGHRHGNDANRDRDDDDRREYREPQHDRYPSNRGSIEISIGGFFADSQRNEAREYYRERSRSGHCPPGLAKKHNGCMAPGQRQWVMGEALPQDVKYEPIDPAIKIRLGMPPEGHKFVRVASDILLIAVGSGLVVDAIQDIGQ